MVSNDESKGPVTKSVRSDKKLLVARITARWMPGLAAILAVLAAGCPAPADESRPPPDQFFFPSGLAVAPDESVLFVSNANSELLYDSGTVLAVELERLEVLIEPWLAEGQVPANADCDTDPLAPALLQCNEAEVIGPESGVRIGNFATDLAVQELASGDLRLFVAVRGDPSVTWIDYAANPVELSCAGSGVVPLCDEKNRLRYLRDDPTLSALVTEPFEIYVDSINEYALVTHQSSAAVSLVHAPRDGKPPILADRIGGLFTSNGDGIRAALGVAGRLPGSLGDLVYVTSRSEQRVQMLYVLRLMGSLPVLVLSEFFFLESVAPPPPSQGIEFNDDARGIAFNADGSRAHIVNRDPPMLHTYDTALDEHGFPRNRFLSSVELCRDPSNVVVADTGSGERAYVTCFPSGQVWVVNPRAARLESIIEVGRGPHAIAVAPARKRLYVANFLEDTISVVDLTPNVPTENRVILRLGRTRQTGGK